MASAVVASFARAASMSGIASFVAAATLALYAFVASLSSARTVVSMADDTKGKRPVTSQLFFTTLARFAADPSAASVIAFHMSLMTMFWYGLLKGTPGYFFLHLSCAFVYAA